ncbi:MAG: hypothetical protein JEZ00_20500 [Anaerolineaceae bacterium]|nr:hypothetical protein [Anaerolineaceae bacterium]
MISRHRYMLYLLVSLFLGIAIVSNASMLFAIAKLWNPQEINKDANSMWRERLEALLDDIPESGTIGYMSEQDIPGMEFNEVDTNEEYVLTQYFLAPRILVQSTQYSYVIGNFADLEIKNDSQIEQLTGLEVLSSYGYGIYLLRGNEQ